MRTNRTTMRWAAAALAGLWLAGLWLAGCMSVGQDFEVSAVRRIEIGRTTQNDVRRMFGSPWRTGVDDGQKTWTYGHYRYSLFGPSDSRDLVIRFDEQGIVRSYTFNSSYPEDRNL